MNPLLFLFPGEVWLWRVGRGFCVLRRKSQTPSRHHHPLGHRSDAALHRRVRLLLQVGVNALTLLTKIFYFTVSELHLVCSGQEEESAGGAGIREGEASAGESGGKCSRSLQEGVHR